MDDIFLLMFFSRILKTLSCISSIISLLFQLRFLGALSSAWLERYLDMVEVIGSSPIEPTMEGDIFL
jgi:hypothetical protein